MKTNQELELKDGLHIFPMICFNCKTFSEFASDPNDSSGKSINGIEYFKSQKLNKKHISEALIYVNKMNNKIQIKKLKLYEKNFKYRIFIG